MNKCKRLLAYLASLGVEDTTPNQDTEKINTSVNNNAHAHLFKANVEDQESKAAAAKNFGGAIPSHQPQLGLQITLAARNEHKLGPVNVILWKQDRGTDAISCKKTQDKFVKALEPKIMANNISRILTSVNADAYNVVTNALSWQGILKNIWHFCGQHDMV